jgi:hypothetical protein
VHVEDRKICEVKSFKNVFAESRENALGEGFFAESYFLALGEEFFTEIFFSSLRIIFLLSAKSSSPRAQALALTKAFYSRRRLCFP